MKKVLRSLLFLPALLWMVSCNPSVSKKDNKSTSETDSSNNGNNSQTSSSNVKFSKSSEIYGLVNQLPIYGNNSRITFPKNDFISVEIKKEGKSETLTELQNVPDSYLSKQREKIKSIEEGYLSENRSISDIKADMVKNKDDDYFADGLEISFMLNIDLNEKFTTILSLRTETKNGEPQNDEWVIYSINADGNIISEMIRFDDVTVHGNQLLSVWYYASDPYPMYELWQLNQEGIFEMISSEKNPPSWYKK